MDVAASTYRVPGVPIAGWSVSVMRAAMRNLPWQNIATELVDNALANKKNDAPCVVRAIWQTKGSKNFIFSDNGRGNRRPEVFLQPGLSGGNHDSRGNSTFGTGLFACEAHLGGRMIVATEADDRTIRVVQRTLKTSEEGAGENIAANRETRAEYCIPSGGGTSIGFSEYAKKGPTASDIERIIEYLGRCYAIVLERAELQITIALNGKNWRVKPEVRPALNWIKTERIEIDEHAFSVEWGVTSEPTADAGCRLVYGGKFFETTSEPCGDYDLGRFYACITIPLSAGQDSMDLLKRSVEKEFMDDLYDRCATLFESALLESHELCSTAADRKLSDIISTLLSSRAGSTEGGEIKPEGSEDRRQFNGRDHESEGIKPANSGRKRKGRKKSEMPNRLVSGWAPMAESGPMAKYDPAGNRLTYNSDIELLASWRSTQAATELAQVGAAHVANVLCRMDSDGRNTLFGIDGDFDDLYKEFMHRIASGPRM